MGRKGKKIQVKTSGSKEVNSFNSAICAFLSQPIKFLTLVLSWTIGHGGTWAPGKGTFE